MAHHKSLPSFFFLPPVNPNSPVLKTVPLCNRYIFFFNNEIIFLDSSCPNNYIIINEQPPNGSSHAEYILRYHRT